MVLGYFFPANNLEENEKKINFTVTYTANAKIPTFTRNGKRQSAKGENGRKSRSRGHFAVRVSRKRDSKSREARNAPAEHHGYDFLGNLFM